MTRALLAFLVMACLPGCEAGSARWIQSSGTSVRRVDTGDTSASVSVWQPGDPIPGWEDYDCGAPEDASYAEVTMSDVTYAPIGISGPGDGTTTQRHGRVSAADCATSADPACPSYGNARGSNGFSYFAIEYTDTSGIAVDPRGQGRFLGEGARYDLNYGETQLQYWEAWRNDEYDTARVGFCLSRVRPDELSGVLEVYPRLWHSGTADYLQFYHDLRVRIPFTVSFGDHSAELTDEPTDSFVEPDGADRVSYGYFGLTYDEAWPWDDITDPTIRDAVYERYTPWNTP